MGVLIARLSRLTTIAVTIYGYSDRKCPTKMGCIIVGSMNILEKGIRMVIFVAGQSLQEARLNAYYSPD
jgi:uncharacterized membrane protein